MGMALERVSTRRPMQMQVNFLLLVISGIVWMTARAWTPASTTASKERLRLLFEAPSAFSAARALVDRHLKSTKALTLVQGHQRPSDSYAYLFGALNDDPKIYTMRINDITTIVHLSPRDKRLHYMISVAYRGDSFCGWQRQATEQISVQGSLEEWIREYLQPSDEGVNLRVCGRTDAGVHAVSQVCRFRTRRELDEADFQSFLWKKSSDTLRVQSVKRASLDFHPTSGCQCRAYVYMMEWKGVTTEQVDLLDSMLRQLEGEQLNYFAMSYGQLSRRQAKCTLLHARAMCSSQDVVSIKLAGNRFLRRMVRLLVASALRLVLEDEPVQALHDLILRQQRATDPAPPDGLIFVSAVFAEV